MGEGGQRGKKQMLINSGAFSLYFSKWDLKLFIVGVVMEFSTIGLIVFYILLD